MPSPIFDPLSAPSILRGLRVCFLAGTLGQGGAERQLFYNLKCLTECGAKVDLLSMTQREHWEKPVSNLGVAIHYVGGSGPRLRRLLAVWSTVRRLRPQVVQAQHFYVNLYAAVAARLSGCRSVGAIRNNVISEMADVGGPLGRASLRKPHMLACNSKAAAGSLLELGVPESRIFYLPNVVDDSLFAPSSLPHAGCFTILGIGRLVSPKRFDLFLQVLARVSSTFPVKGIIAGEGPLRKELEAQARKLRLLPGRVEFLGRIDDAAALYRRANALLLTSDHEGTPNVVMEAMACGLPVVASNVGGVPDLVRNGETGFLFQPEDHASAVTALQRLANEPRLAQEMGKRARAFIEQHHSPRLLAEILSQLYGQILAFG